MRINFNISKLLMLAAMVVSLTVTSAKAEHPGGGEGRFGGHFGGRMGCEICRIKKLIKVLDVTPAQKKQMAALIRSQMDALQSAREKTKDARRALFESMQSDSFDEKQVRSAAHSLAVAEEEGAVGGAKLMASVKAVLTPEQRQKLAAKRAEFKSRFEQRRKEFDRSKQDHFEEILKLLEE